ncbi:MAG: lysozyme [Robiginitomaculum sp.]|nr:lysozyme [Robiginitomaculum sp.]
MARYVTSPTGFELIKAFEGFRAKAAPLANGGWVVGYGHTVSARKGTQISKNDASDLLRWDVKQLEGPLCDLIYAPLSQNQFDALVSLTFNIGLEHFQSSSVLRRLNEGCPVAAAAGFDAWRRASLNGEIIVVDALVRRRAAEKALFLASPEASVIAPTPQLPPLCDMQMASEQQGETPLKVMFDLNGNGDTIIESATNTPAPAPVDIPSPIEASETQEDLVSLDEAFETETPPTEINTPETVTEEPTANPMAEIAEQITGRLETIAADDTDAPQDEVLQLQAEDQVPTQDLPTTDVSHDEEATPPFVDQDGMFLEPYEANPEPTIRYDALDEGVEPFAYDEPVYEETDLDPQTLLTDAQITPDSGDFQPAYDRGRIIFILMGIIGIAMTLGGLWQIQNADSITTNLELAKGPGQAFLGVLLVVVSAYYLLRRLNR